MLASQCNQKVIVSNLCRVEIVITAEVASQVASNLNYR